jgi:hypothetical protein
LPREGSEVYIVHCSESRVSVAQHIRGRPCNMLVTDLKVGLCAAASVACLYSKMNPTTRFQEKARLTNALAHNKLAHHHTKNCVISHLRAANHLWGCRKGVYCYIAHFFWVL